MKGFSVQLDIRGYYPIDLDLTFVSTRQGQIVYFLLINGHG